MSIQKQDRKLKNRWYKVKNRIRNSYYKIIILLYSKKRINDQWKLTFNYSSKPVFNLSMSVSVEYVETSSKFETDEIFCTHVKVLL